MVQHQCSARVLLAKCNCPLLSASMQNRLAAGLFCCKFTYGDLLLTQACSGPTPVQCQSAFGKMQLPLLSAVGMTPQLCYCLILCINSDLFSSLVRTPVAAATACLTYPHCVPCAVVRISSSVESQRTEYNATRKQTCVTCKEEEVRELRSIFISL